MSRKRSYRIIVPILLVATILVSFSLDQKEDKKKGKKQKGSKNQVDPMVAFREEVGGYRKECKAALKPYRYSFGRTTFFNYKGYNTAKEIEVSLMLDARYKFTFNAQGVTLEPIKVQVYNRPSDYNKRILLFEKSGISSGSFYFTSDQLFENLKKHYKEKGLSDEEIEKLLLSKVYIDYIIPAIDEEFEVDPESGRRKAILKKGAIVFASGYENLDTR